jgi:hypothetical protein
VLLALRCTQPQKQFKLGSFVTSAAHVSCGPAAAVFGQQQQSCRVRSEQQLQQLAVCISIGTQRDSALHHTTRVVYDTVLRDVAAGVAKQ